MRLEKERGEWMPWVKRLWPMWRWNFSNAAQLIASALAADADEDAKDLADARAALEDVRKNGGSPWE